MNKIKKLTVSAILVAFSIVLLYLASVFPVLSLSLIAVAGLLPAVVVIECGVASAAVMYIASCALALLLVPDKSCAILYAVLFGNYPFVKYFSERVRSRLLSWGIKFAVANALFALLFFVFRSVMLSFVPGDIMTALIFVMFQIVFVLYDLCFTKLTGFYMVRIHPHIV